ncbi:SPOR domain-containing protein [Rhodoferax sp.]|uniref:SPOR domain-containing protein n=1 Tax=Rhodoferax sp. TaxID=50421 RepID=UPI00275E754F|nr:SPOR domain-containing protein [Rhodoferax sp.]
MVTDPTGTCQACGHVAPVADSTEQPPRIEPTFRDAPDAAAPSPVMQELYKAVVGARGQDYYLKQFARFDDAGKPGITWHWPAFFSTLNWLAWRGMWSAALVFAASCLGLGLAVFGIGRLVFDFSATTELALLALCLAFMFVLPGLFGNAAYYRFSKKRIEAALAASSTIDEACESLAAQAGSNRRWFVLAATNSSLIVVVGVFAWLLTSSSTLEQFNATVLTQAVSTTPVTPGVAPASSQPDMSPQASAASAAPAAEVLLTSAPAEPTSTAVLRNANLVVVGTTEGPPPPRAQQSGPIGREPTELRGNASPAVKSAKAPASATATASASASASAASGSAAAPAEFRFALQVGAFANEDNARKAQAKLQAAGFKAYSEVLETSQGKRIRVRVGPFATRSEAEQAAPLIKELDLPALLVKL